MHFEVLKGQYIIIFLNHLNHFKKLMDINPLNAELNPICHLLALLGGATVVVVSRLRVKKLKERLPGLCHVVSCRPLTTDTGFNPGPVQVGFVVNYVTVILLQVLWFFLVSIISPTLQTHSPITKTIQSPLLTVSLK